LYPKIEDKDDVWVKIKEDIGEKGAEIIIPLLKEGEK